MHVAVPKGPNERLLTPPLSEVAPCAHANREHLDAATISIGGTPLADLRAGLRHLLLKLAKCDPDDSRPLGVSAHQPGLPHPGILFKHAVLNRLAPELIPFNIVVESDVVEEVCARVPARHGNNISIEAFPLARTARRVVISHAPKPERRAFEHGLNDVRRAAATLANDDILEAIDRFAAIHREEYPQHDSLSTMLTAYRSRYFPTPRVHDVPLSSLCQADAFRVFAAALIQDAKGFLTAHNDALARHRRERRIRTTVNPFPNLRREHNALDVPFWHISRDGRRSAVFVEPHADHTMLATHAEQLGAFATRAELDELLTQTTLRPKAVALTMFLRLCVADFFLHGVTGANYDNATDMIIRDFLRIEPPAYGVASLSLRLPLTYDDSLEQRTRELAYRARRMTWNPDEFVPNTNPLAAEKRRILMNAGARLTREEHEKIESVRTQLLDEIAAARRTNEQDLAAAQQALAAQQRLGARDLPYFLYPLLVLQAAAKTPKTTSTG